MNGFASYVKEGERLDDLQLNGLYIIQNPSHFCFGGDSVGLADFASVKAGETVADLCTGSGVIPILLSAKTRARSFVGIEIITEVAEMARRSVLMNGLGDRIEIINDDIKNAPDMFKNGAFDVVTANPPYHRGGLRSPGIAKASAKHEISCQLPQLISVSAALLKNGGRLYVS
ncbi:MAG: methyltransferase, partial [Defluviitaleaceae bacterium]|nr:methyltransferase [Defluviitaleaceae bacterium]